MTTDIVKRVAELVDTVVADVLRVNLSTIDGADDVIVLVLVLVLFFLFPRFLLQDNISQVAPLYDQVQGRQQKHIPEGELLLVCFLVVLVQVYSLLWGLLVSTSLYQAIQPSKQ